jgi:hypothetical protein
MQRAAAMEGLRAVSRRKIFCWPEKAGVRPPMQAEDGDAPSTPQNPPGPDHGGGGRRSGGAAVRFNTKIAVVLREDLAVWQK